MPVPLRAAPAAALLATPVLALALPTPASPASPAPAAAAPAAAAPAAATPAPSRSVPPPAGDVAFRLSDPRIAESSSLVAASDGVHLYTTNDSGDSARVFVLDRAGRTVAVHVLPGVQAVDVEDAALGPGPALYLADTGDNTGARRDVLLHVLPEPGTGPVDVRTVRLTYEDEAHDAEALLVHPRTGQVLVVTKSVFGPAAYEVRDGVLRRAAAVRVGLTGTRGGPEPAAAAQLLVTGGAVSPDGRRLALRTYTDAYVYEVPGDDLAAALGGSPTVVPLPATPQGEALTWTRDGRALLTSTEGVRAPVHRVPVPGGAAVGPSSAGPPAPRPDRGPARGPDWLPALPVGRLEAGGVLLGGAGLVGLLALRLARRRRRRPERMPGGLPDVAPRRTGRR